MYGPDAPLTHAGPGEHDIEEGSIFFGLHRDLAVEADSHVINKIGEVWEEKTRETRIEALRSSPGSTSNTITSEASRRQRAEQQRATAEGRYSEAGDFTLTAHTELMAMVDLFIAHPDDSTWWRPILSSYVSAHEAEVIRHIRARNRTRASRR